MYISIYIFRVSKNNVRRFLELQRKAAEIYKHYGVLEDITYVSADLKSKYGCTAFGDIIDVSEDEVVLIEISSFRDRTHHNEVMAKVDSDEHIEELYVDVTTLLDVGRIVRGEFESTV